MAKDIEKKSVENEVGINDPMVQEGMQKGEAIPSDPEQVRPEKEDIYAASQWKLMGIKFRRHKLAVVSVWILVIVYIIGFFCGFLSPYNPNQTRGDSVYMAPQRIRFFSDEGFHLRPFVYGMTGVRNPETLRIEYETDTSQRYPIHLFVRGDSYKFWGMFETDLHLFGVKEGTIHLYGTDRLGRDLLSRIFYGTRISTTIGLIGVTLTLIIGVLLGGLSGYFGGFWDNLLQRLIEFLKSIPKLPLWMGLSAAIPIDWPITWVFFSITIILSLIGWTGLARVVRSKFLSLREEDFVVAARLGGVKPVRIVLKHMVPSFLSYIIARVTLALPQMILRETSLSFLGLGMQPPAISWGVLLKDAQNIHAVALHPWLLIPGAWVIVTILAFNFVGDGLRDAADPYGR